MKLEGSVWSLRRGLNDTVTLTVEAPKQDEDGSRARFEADLSQSDVSKLIEALTLLRN